jgi:hypothetical protein
VGGGGGGGGENDTLKAFCKHIVYSNPIHVIKAVQISKARNPKYRRCEGTTTVMFNKRCFHRQCYCITKVEERAYEPDTDSFSNSDIASIKQNEVYGKKYSICHRHARKVPFAYLGLLNLSQLQATDELLERVLGIEMFEINHGRESKDIENLVAEIRALLPQLKEIGRQDAIVARSSIKRKLDFVNNNLLKKNTNYKEVLNTVIEEMYTSIDENSSVVPHEIRVVEGPNGGQTMVTTA